ncbi:WD40 repeat-containing protein [Nitzschia inconspicua]|uniref:WD40 repeat-containing protein n=1 Tax=Nitzschia inconspicua TaxID=303405 RepID=A0A9K3KBQ8_9STRA|nr:WD40 repeat-containing protein [Nitzschia inconspicua]
MTTAEDKEPKDIHDALPERVSRGTVSERAANKRISEIEREQSKRPSEEKALISKYNVEKQQRGRLKQIKQDDQELSVSANSRLNEYQKRALEKRIRYSQHKTNKTVRSKLQTYKAKRYESAVAAADAQVVLHTQEAGFLQAEHDLEFTTRLKQVDLKRRFLDENTSRHIYDLKLDSFGPYGCKFDRSGRYSVLFGQRGHLALMDSHQLCLHHEFHVQERVRDACFLHNFGLLAVAQINHVYVYDDMGVEIHKLGEHSDPMALEFLPYHWLLASVGRSGLLKYQDTSTGEVVSTLRTKLGPCDVMRQNPSNAVVHLGHSNGTVTLWSPSSSQYLVKLQCHKGAPVTSMAIDLSGNTMVTGGADRQIKIWDLRMFQCTHAYFCDAGTPSSLDISQRNVLGVGHSGHATFWAPEALKKKVKQPYMHHAMSSTSVETLRFRPFEDVCAIGHSQGMSSIVIPGSGEPNLDTTEYNLDPHQDKKQRREAEIRALMDKLDPNMITLDPEQIGGMEESNPENLQERLRDIREEAEARDSWKIKKQRTKRRGRSKIQTQLRRKQANVIDRQILKLREARDKEKLSSSREDDALTHSTSMEDQRLMDSAPKALKRFFNVQSSIQDRTIDESATAASTKWRKGKSNLMFKGSIMNALVAYAIITFICSLEFVQGTEEASSLVHEEFLIPREEQASHIPAPMVGLSTGSCSSLTTCENCTNTYSCHWCERTESCHTRGSFYGCSWGSTCHKSDPPKPKENSTCAAHTSCVECTLASHFCHWCEHDNACHAVGSPYGCTVGVDCYSNDRCRRKTSEPLPGGLFNSDIPMSSLVIILTIGFILVGCLTCCHYVTTNVKGAYDDLATITMAASMAPMSVIGGNNGQFYSTLDPHPEEEEGEEESINAPTTSPEVQQQPPAGSVDANQKEMQGDEQVKLGDAEAGAHDAFSSHDFLAEANTYAITNDSPSGQNAARPLLHPSFNGSVLGTMHESSHMRRLYTCCTIIYAVFVVLVLTLVGASILFYPQKPLYSVCNDAVAWKRIMTNIATFKFDASFEILLSLSNPNHLGAFLDRGKGSYLFEGKQVGTFEIPPVAADAMAISDIMLIAHVSPDRQQALQLIDAYYLGKLLLEAEFEGTVRIPALFDSTFDIHVKSIVVDVNALADRSLCHCPTWDDRKNHTTDAPIFLFEG